MVKQVKNGNNDKFSELYEESYRYLHTCVIHIVKSEEIAQDMLQETYMEIFKNINQLNREEDFLSWASTIANRKCFAHLKKNKDILVDEPVDDEGNESDYFEQIADDAAFIPENILDNQEKVKILRDMIDSLSDIQRACVIGVYYNEQKQDDIARELGIPVNTVKSHLSRAKAKLKETIDTTEKKQGIKLYSFAPFMLLLWGKEADFFQTQNVVAPMSEALVQSISGMKTASLTGSAVKAATGKAAGMGLKAKILIGAAAVAVVSCVTVGAIGIANASHKGLDSTQSSISSSVEASVSDAVVSKEQTDEQKETPSVSSEEVQEVSSDSSPEDETELEKLKEAAFENGYISSIGNGYVVFYDYDTEKEGMYDYEGNLLFSLEGYSYAQCNPNVNGYSVFATDDEETMEYCVLDKSGNVVFSLEDWYVKGMSDDYLLASDYVGESLFRLADGSELIRTEEWVDFGMYIHPSGLTCFSEGYAFANIDGELMRIDSKGNKERVLPQIVETEDPNDHEDWFNGTWSNSYLDMIIPAGALCEGYFTAYDANDNNIDYLISADGSEVYTIDEKEVFADFVSQQGWEESDELYDIIKIEGITVDGVTVGNIGEYVIFYVYDTNDIDKHWQVVYNVKTHNCWYNLNTMCISKDAIWMRDFWDEEYNPIKVEYLDHDGNVLAEYTLGTYFHEGKAMVLDKDKVYTINENFEKVSEEIPASYISGYSGLALVEGPETGAEAYYWY